MAEHDSNLPAVHGRREPGEPAEAVHHTPTKLWAAIAVLVLGACIIGAGVIVHSGDVVIISVGAVLVIAGGIAAWSMGIMSNVH